MVAVAERLVVLGCQEPSIEHVPVFSRSLAAEAVELGERCGITPDPWQRRVLDAMLALDEDGNFAAFKVGINVPRQNGKGALLELRELAGIFLLGERFVTHSSQQMDTSLDHMRRLVEDLEEGGLTSELLDRGGIMTGNGRESLRFKSGQTIRFRTRSRTGGRGLTGTPVVLDEAMFIAEYQHSVLIPMLTTLERPQVIYAGSAPDQHVHEHAVVWAKLREEAIQGDNPRLAYFEWSAGYQSPEEVPEELDMEQAAKANPALGIRITEQYLRDEWTALDQRGRAVERLGVGDYPRTDFVQQTVIDIDAWASLADQDSEAVDPVWVAFDVSPDRTAAVAVAGFRQDGRLHVEVAKTRSGTSWLPGYLAAMVDKHDPAEVVCDGVGPVASVLGAIVEAGVPVRTVSAAEHGAACGKFVDLIREDGLRHLEQPSLTNAIRGAVTRPMNDSWLWSRKSSSVDISPLVAATLALDGALAGVGAGDPVIF